jgi:S1-C subfamily serine protease
MAEQSSPFAELSSTFADLVAATSPQIVEVQSHRSLASGFFWRDGLILTPDETLADEGPIQVELSDNTVLDAALLGRDPATDIALLRVASVGHRAAVFSKGAVRAGALTLVVAAAESASLTTFGMIVAVGPAWQSMRGGKIDARIEMDIRLRHRAEGGLAIDGGGKAIGMAVRGPRGRTLIIPGATIERVAGQLLEHGRVPVAYLGVSLKDVPLSDGASGAMVMTIDQGGPAASGGLQQGDVIVTWAQEPMRNAAMLLRALRATAVGTTVTLGLQRAGTPHECDVTVEDRSAK